jgi:hypothetical protein
LQREQISAAYCVEADVDCASFSHHVHRLLFVRLFLGKIGLCQNSAPHKIAKPIITQSTGPVIPTSEHRSKLPHVKSLPRDSHSVEDVPSAHQTNPTMIHMRRAPYL